MRDPQRGQWARCAVARDLEAQALIDHRQHLNLVSFEDESRVLTCNFAPSARGYAEIQLD